jgi:hypothetical protein
MLLVFYIITSKYITTVKTVTYMAEREIEDFVWVLAIALILLVVVGVFSYFVPYGGIHTNITVGSVSPGEVGYVSDFVARDMQLNTFTVGEDQIEPLRSYPQLELERSWFGGNSEEEEIRINSNYLASARGVMITFDLTQTNSYGNLVIKWNGREIINQQLSERQHNIFIEAEHVKAGNTLEVYTTGPGMMFWASSIYVLKNFNVNLDYGPQRIIPFQITPDEMERFMKAELSAYASGTGRLDIKINGVMVYSEYPRGMITREFTLFDAPMRSGQNILALGDDTGTYTLRDAVFRIYVTGERSSPSSTFEMSEENYNLIDRNILRGRISYRIAGMARPGAVEIRINGREIPTQAPIVGWNSASFTSDDVGPGINTITFSGTGSFDIPEAIISLEN